MQIIHFISGIQSGGVEQMICNYTSYINKDSSISEYIVYQHKPDPSSLKKLEDANNVCVRIPSKAKHPFKNIIATYKIIKKIKPEVVHVHMNLVNFVPLMIAAFMNVPLRISHSHIANDNISLKFMVPIFKKMNLLFSNYRLACGILAGKYMYGNHDYSVLPNAINVEQFRFNERKRSELREYYQISDNTLVIGNVGRLTNQKNQFFLINLFAQYLEINPNSLLFIIGQGDLENQLIDLIKKKNLEDKIRIIKPISHIENYYNLMDYFLLPSLYEGFPVVAVEVQSSGLPLIMSDTIDKSSILTNNTYTAILNNTNSWLNKIKTLSKNDKRNIIAPNIIEKYDISNNYRTLLNIYRKFE